MCLPITKNHKVCLHSVLDTWELPTPRFPSSPVLSPLKPKATAPSCLFILLLMPATHTCTSCHRTKSKTPLAYMFKPQNIAMISCEVSPLLAAMPLYPPAPVVFSSSVHEALNPEVSIAGPAQSISSQRPVLTTSHPPIQISIPKPAGCFLRECLIQSKALHKLFVEWIKSVKGLWTGWI